MVWYNYNGIVNDIYLYNGATTTKLTNNTFGRYSYEPQINNNGQMVWYTYNSDTDVYDIYVYDGTTTTKLTNNSSGVYAKQPQINNNGQVVWYQYDTSYFVFNVYLAVPTIQNNPPVANAGADQSKYVGDTVTLDGSGSSDVDGNALTYSWSFTSRPAGSSAALSSSTSANPTFTVDKAGTYVVSLIVNDGTVNSAADTVTISTLNSAPVANAGTDQTVAEVTSVTLNGSGSSDPEGQPLTYQWVQLPSPTVALNLTDPVHPTFVAPNVSAGGATLTFQLTVNDGQLTSSPDVVNISVTNVNHPPVADAGVDQTVNEGTLVTLDGSASFDPDGDSVTYQWLQTGGTPVTLTGADTAKPTFTAPLIAGGVSGVDTLTFSLTVSDGGLSSTDAVQVVVENVNHAPIANAGMDQTVNEGSVVSLNGTGSSDPDSDPFTYAWTQLSGPAASLSGPGSANPSFTAPPVGPGGMTLVFQLIVNDGLDDSEPDEVTVTVLNVNDPPACNLAQANPSSLWPPNHKMISVGIVGVTDPNNDRVTVKITRVTQDERVNGLGDGDTSPDALIQGDKVLLRAERSGKGNGRVYRVEFTADDGQGSSCSGAVTVGVPPSMKPGMSAVDDGQLYDSTQP